MTTIKRVVLLSACAFHLILYRAQAAEGGIANQNVLFIAVDDLRTNLHCMGDSVALTPNIDRLAAKGVLFERAYCQVPVCNPSRASVMTGRRPDEIKVWDLFRHFRETVPDIVTLPEYFQQHGYVAIDIGKIYHNTDTKIHGDPQSWTIPAKMYWGGHNSDVAQVRGAVPPNLATVPKTEIRDVPDDAYIDGRIATAACETLVKLKQGAAPFFLAVGFWKPHLPFNAPKRYWDMYPPGAVPDPVASDAPKGAPAMALEPQFRHFINAKLSIDETRELRRGYYAATSYVDAQIGKVLNRLESLGLERNTIVVLWSDHGFHLGEQGLWNKTSLFELDARVPLIIAGPGIPLGGRRWTPVELLDLYPTLVDLCGLPPQRSVDGLSLVQVLNDENARLKHGAVTESPRPWNMRPRVRAMGYSIRTLRWRYTEWRNWTDGTILARELYDCESEPIETRNLANDPHFSTTLHACADDLAAVVGSSTPR